MKTSKRAFSLIEVIASVALLAISGFVIAQSCYNMIAPLSIKDKNPEEDINFELALAEILKVNDYEALDDGIDIDGTDGQTYRIYADFEQTQILDLFLLDMRIQSPKKEYNKKMLVIRPNWYEDASDRTDLKEDRVDFLEQKRRDETFER